MFSRVQENEEAGVLGTVSDQPTAVDRIWCRDSNTRENSVLAFEYRSSDTVLAGSGSGSFVFMTKICKRNIFWSKTNAIARYIFLNSKLQENPPVNRRTLHSNKFHHFFIFGGDHSWMLNLGPGQASQLNPDSIR